MTKRQFYDWQTAGGGGDVLLLVETLERGEIPWCMIGGLAVNHWAEEPLATADVDVVIATDRVEQAVRALEEAGFQAKRFEWSINFIPYHDDVKGAPQNSIIGGASLWVMGGKKPPEYRGVAKFFAYLSRPEVQMGWHTRTGYVPITQAAYELTRKSGFYAKEPGAEMVVKQLTHKAPTANSKGLRFGNFVQGREVIEEELEAAFAGRKDAKTAMDDAVRRGNEVLRKFEAANK